MRHAFIPLLVPILLVSCKKYNKLTPLEKPAYIRVFNDISTAPSIQNNGNLNTLLTFLLDPVFDKSNSPVNAGIVGDFLLSRQYYSVSYPTNAANTVAGSGTVNYEYLGREHVITAPSMNGFDMSSWAQAPSGKHRLVFISRPAGDTAFAGLTTAQRSHILVDTTVDLDAGEVYTIEACLSNFDKSIYRAYVRKEEFIHKHYSADSLYTAFFNLNATVDTTIINPYSPNYHWFYNNMDLYGSYLVYRHPQLSYQVLDSFSNIHIPLYQRFSQTGAYLVVPALDSTAFFDPQGNIGIYGQTLPYVIVGVGPENSQTYPNDIQYAFQVQFSEDPVGYNIKYPGSTDWQQIGGYHPLEYLPSLTLLSTIGKKTLVYPTLNIVEIINSKAYLIQIQKGLSQL